MVRKSKNPKLGSTSNAGADDLTESVNEEQDDMGSPVSTPPTKESAPTEEASGKEMSIVVAYPTDDAMTENIATEKLKSSQPGPSSSKQTLEQQVEFLVQSINSFQASEGNYKTLYLESQKKVEALTKENHGLAIQLKSAVAKVEVYDKMREAFGNLKDLVIVSKLTKGPDVLAEFTSQVTSGQGTTPAVATTQSPFNASTSQKRGGKGISPAVPSASPSQATVAQGTTSAVPGGASPSQATGAQGTTSAVAAAPGSSEPRRSTRDRKKKEPEK